jgi:DNA ligase-1
MIVRPMLAVAAEDLEKIVFPVLCSPKLDGIRALKVDGKLLSRSFKPIPNNFIRTMVEHVLPDGVDGELLVGSTFHESSSGVMSQDGQPDFRYAMFDYVSDGLNKPFFKRLSDLQCMLESKSLIGKHFSIVNHVLVSSIGELLKLEQQAVDQGYEGLMIRSMSGPYKCGRSTMKEGYLLKVKRFEDSEAVILDYEEQMHNTNEAKKDAFGKTERSSAKDGMVPKGVLGTLIVRDVKSGIEFKIGTGFDDDQRVKLWKDRSSLPGRMVKYKFQPSGIKEAPRFPTIISFRDEIDL